MIDLGPPLTEAIEEPLWFHIVQTSTLSLAAVFALASVAVCLTSLLSSKQSNAIQLPISDSPTPAPSAKERFGQKLLDNLEDIPAHGGDFVQIETFWRKTTALKLLCVLSSLVLASIQGERQWQAIRDTVSVKANISVAITTAVSVYLLGLAVWYVFTADIARHRSLTYHIFTLAIGFALHLYMETLGQYLIPNTHSALTWLDWTLLGSDLAIVACVGMISCEPLRHTDLTKLYNEAVNSALRDMSTPFDEANVSAQYSSSIISQLTGNWIIPQISRMARVDQVDIQDLPAMHAAVQTQISAKEMSDFWSRRRFSPRKWGPTKSFLLEVWLPQWKAFLLNWGMATLLVPMWYLPHYALQNVLSSIEGRADMRTAVAWGVVMLLGRLLNLIVIMAQNFLTETFIRPRIHSQAKYLLYGKLLMRNLFAKPKADTRKYNRQTTEKTVASHADILNLISVDVVQVSRVGFSFFNLFRSQLELICGAAYVWLLLGPSGMWGLSTMLITTVPSYFITKWQYKIFEKRLAISDERVSLMQEAIQAISMIKMMAAERFWYRRIKTTRDREFQKLVQARTLGFISGLLYRGTPTLIIVTAFAHYTLVAKQTLTPTIAFTSIAVFEELRPVLLNLPDGIARLLQEILSAKRIGLFIRARDVDYLDESALRSSSVTDTGPLEMHCTVGWDDEKTPFLSQDPQATAPVQDFKLRDIDVSFNRGEISLIAGKFGSGKTLMLLALMGEARLLEGRITYATSESMDAHSSEPRDFTLAARGVAYVPQTAWLQSLSIRDNILFGLPMDMDRYRAVVHAVGLLPDLEVLEDADLTEIGERGKILSGGQKARVSLARAVYSKASILLLDDVISAVDAHTSQHIIKHCFQGPLMAGRTVIIASHAVEALAPLSDKAVFLDCGRVMWQGTGRGLLNSEHMNHLRTEVATHLEDTHGEDLKEVDDEDHATKHRKPSINADTAGRFEIREAPAKTPRQLIFEEKRMKGQIEFKHWQELVKFNGGVVFWVALFALTCMVASGAIFERRILELWTDQANDPAEQQSNIVFWVAIYSAFTAANIIIATLFQVMRFVGGLRTMKRVHSLMLANVLKAKMLFFTKTRAGSIVQRFGKDLGDLSSGSELLGDLAETVLSILLSLVTVTLYGGWVFGAVNILVFVALYKPSVWYRSASRQIRRLQSILPGPINAIYGETIAGAAIIRAFGVQYQFMNDLLRNLNMNMVVDMWGLYVGYWLYINIELMDLVLTATMLLIIFTAPNMSASAAGFILAFSGSISGNVNWLLRQWRDFELYGISLERSSEYRHLETEDDEVLVGKDNDSESDTAGFETLMKDWPSKGALEVSELSARYGPDMPEILHKISFKIEGGERVGIVGATGGGKSTLAKALFSFVDISHDSIFIDGKDTSTIPLGLLRSRLGIIAQDPILLSGTLRLNLDIESQYTDEQLYGALHQVQLIQRKGNPTSVSSIPPTSLLSQANEDAALAPKSPTSTTSLLNDPESVVDGREANANIFQNLDFEIKSGGENLSAGQKQLVVLARALLRQQKVLIMDEATANIDSATDAEISRVVHEEFAGATVLIIAHRLRTIMPCSKILVMDKVDLVQQGSPAELMTVDGGRFQELCKAAGPEEYRHLVSLAEQASKKSLLVDVN